MSNTSMTEISPWSDTNQNAFVFLLWSFSMMTTNLTDPTLSSLAIFFLDQDLGIVHFAVLSD